MRAAILFFAVLTSACGTAAVATGSHSTPAPAPVAAIAPREAELRLDVVELTCHSCAGQVAEGTARIPGVLHVSAEMLDHILVVTYDPTRLTEASLVAAIDKVVETIAD